MNMKKKKIVVKIKSKVKVDLFYKFMKLNLTKISNKDI